MTRCRWVLLAALMCLQLSCSNKAKKADDKLNDPPPDGEAAARRPDGPPVVRQTNGASEEPPAETADAEASVTRAELDGFLDRGPSYVLTIVEVEPIHSPKGFVGYQITEVKSPGARDFMMPQLRVGDVVTHVNGVRLLRPDDYMQAWRSLDKATTIRIDFLRQQETAHATWAVK